MTLQLQVIRCTKLAYFWSNQHNAVLNHAKTGKHKAAAEQFQQTANFPHSCLDYFA